MRANDPHTDNPWGVMTGPAAEARARKRRRRAQWVCTSGDTDNSVLRWRVLQPKEHELEAYLCLMQVWQVIP